MKNYFKLILVCCVLLTLFSCRRDEFAINKVECQPYVRKDSTMGISVFVQVTATEENKIRMSVTSPDGTLQWNFTPQKVRYEGQNYLGTPAINMPLGSILPKGEWTLSLFYKDGRTIEHRFKVDYGDNNALYERSSKTNKTFYDTPTNLTYLHK